MNEAFNPLLTKKQKKSRKRQNSPGTRLCTYCMTQVVVSTSDKTKYYCPRCRKWLDLCSPCTMYGDYRDKYGETIRIQSDKHNSDYCSCGLQKVTSTTGDKNCPLCFIAPQSTSLRPPPILQNNSPPCPYCKTNLFVESYGKDRHFCKQCRRWIGEQRPQIPNWMRCTKCGTPMTTTNDGHQHRTCPKCKRYEYHPVNWQQKTQKFNGLPYYPNNFSQMFGGSDPSQCMYCGGSTSIIMDGPYTRQCNNCRKYM